MQRNIPSLGRRLFISKKQYTAASYLKKMRRFLAPAFQAVVGRNIPRVAPVTMFAAQTNQASFVWGSSHKMPENYVNKAAQEKVAQEDDERWLEAELDENILSPEEVFAKKREKELLRNMLKNKEKNGN